MRRLARLSTDELTRRVRGDVALEEKHVALNLLWARGEHRRARELARDDPSLFPKLEALQARERAR